MSASRLFDMMLNNCVGAVPSDDQQGVNALIAMTDDGVKKAVGSCFQSQMQNAGQVKGTFFASAGAPTVALPAGSDWVGDVASALVALSVGQSSTCSFSSTVDTRKAQEYINSKLTPDDSGFVSLATYNYTALFPDNCTDGTTYFREYMNNNPVRWGGLLADALSSQDYINKEMNSFNADPSGFFQQLYMNFYKVKALSPGDVERVKAAWNNALQGHQVSASWEVYEYMLATSYNYDTFFSPVSSAINQSYSKSHTLGCHGGPAASCTSETDTYYGEAVASWLGSHRAYPFITGNNPNNVTSQVNSGSGCCFKAGSPVLMADGTSKAIEQVREGESIMGFNGIPLQRSGQDVVWDLEENELLFGINDYPPFFNASHPLKTTEGWKAIHPDAARKINPGLEISKLKIGDKLIQVESLDPFSYKEIEIQVITKELGDQTKPIYSLHLHHENTGYHVHGFRVAVNYPVITEDSFVNAFARLTEAERRMAAKHMLPILPFLKQGMGNYVEQIVKRALLI